MYNKYSPFCLAHQNQTKRCLALQNMNSQAIHKKGSRYAQDPFFYLSVLVLVPSTGVLFSLLARSQAVWKIN